MIKKTGYIAGITRGHNAGVCLLKDGEIVFAIEEERLTRVKYDGGPFASMVKILDYTDKIDYLVIAHTTPLATDENQKIDYSSDNVYTAMARKLGLIDRHANRFQHPQVVDMAYIHHKLHASCAFYRSGFDNATAVVVDGAGTAFNYETFYEDKGQFALSGWETESIFTCSYADGIKTVWKSLGSTGPSTTAQSQLEDPFTKEIYNVDLSESAGITKTYEAVTKYCGFTSIEAGKTMGLFPYGKNPANLPPFFENAGIFRIGNRNLIVPFYPNSAEVSTEVFNLNYDLDVESTKSDYKLYNLQSRKDLAYKVQTETQEEVLKLILHASEITNNKNIVLSGGYGLNCVANYYFLDTLNKNGIKLYVEPISNDGGTAIGAAFLQYRYTTYDTRKFTSNNSIYLGPIYNYTVDDVQKITEKYKATYKENVTCEEIIKLIREKTIVGLFQGRSENGPRALGNRSLIFDPTIADGKDFVNTIKHREYFRPFAGSILEEDVHDWFDLKGMDSSPTMMYAVDCKKEKIDSIPSIVHVDGTCRIQTVNVNQNKHFYDLILEFKKQTGVPILFNTSFNLGGDPLIETLDDALYTLEKSDLEYLYLPELSILIKLENI